ELSEVWRGEGILVFDVHRHLRVMRKLILRVIAEFEVLFLYAERLPPAHPLGFPELVPGPGFVGMAEPFHLHLLKLARAKDEIARRNLIPKPLSNLRNAERDFHARGVDDVFVVEEDALGGFGAQIDLDGVDGANFAAEHEV